MVVVAKTGQDAELWVNDEGELVGLFGRAPEVLFTTRRELVDAVGERQADEIMRQLFIISFGADEKLVA